MASGIQNASIDNSAPSMIPRGAASESASPESRRSSDADGQASSTSVTAMRVSPIGQANGEPLMQKS
jgi:hypothetical protein